MVEPPGFVAAMDPATEVETERLAIAARVVVLVVSYNGLADLRECLESLVSAHGYDGSVHLVVLDNASTDGSPDAIEKQFPQVTVLRSNKNLGYAGGGNAGWHWIQQNCPSAEYLCVLNQDIIVEPNWLDALVDHLDQNPDVGLAQPMICLEPERHLINNLGLRCHYLGYAYQVSFSDPVDCAIMVPCDVDAISGAAFLIRCCFLVKYGLFNGELFMYMEDVELSWRMLASGSKCVCVPTGTVYHKHQLSEFRNSYILLERNRLFLVAIYYHWFVLLILAPVFLLNEFTQIAWASSQGMAHRRVKILCELFSLARLTSIVKKRREVKTLRIPLCVHERFTGAIQLSRIEPTRAMRVGVVIFNLMWFFGRCLLTLAMCARKCVASARRHFAIDHKMI